MLVSGVVLGQPMGGVSRHNRELLPRVARRLAELDGELVVLEGREPISFDLPAEVERLPSSVPAGPPLVRATLEGRFLRRVLAEARQAGRPFDILHTAHFPVPKRLAVRSVVTVHDLRSLQLEHTPMSRRLLARGIIGGALERSAGVITVSETVRSDLLERFALEPERVSVVPNAADHFTPLPRAAGPAAPLLHVGHIERRKNLELVLRALAIDSGLPELTLAGAPKAGEDERLRRLAAEFGVEGRLRFLGAFDDSQLPALYAGAACVVMPSRLEGFGIPVLEAQRAGVPLAVARAGALSEVAGEEVPSFDVDDAAQCAAAIRAALSQPESTRRAAAARADARSWSASAELWVAAWQRARRYVPAPSPPRSAGPRIPLPGLGRRRGPSP